MSENKKTALITGITGQDGSYLAELLLAKGYRVVGMISRHHNPLGSANIAHIEDKLDLCEGDLVESESLLQIFTTYRPDEVYNLAAITFVPQGWEVPTVTFDINLLGVARLFEAMFRLGLTKTRLFQASSAEMFGKPTTSPLTEETPMRPVNLYGISKLAAHQVIGAMRAEKDFFAVSGILFNHESPRRGQQFVTRKITQTAARIKLGLVGELLLGDLEAARDWGYAPDYVQAMWLMLQQNKPDDFVIATGVSHIVRDICEVAFTSLGLNYQDFVKTDPAFLRKTDVRTLLGDANKAKSVLGWQPKTDFAEMITQMTKSDYEQLAKESHV